MLQIDSSFRNAERGESTPRAHGAFRSRILICCDGSAFGNFSELTIGKSSGGGTSKILRQREGDRNLSCEADLQFKFKFNLKKLAPHINL